MNSAWPGHTLPADVIKNTHQAFVGILNIINCNLQSVAWRKCHYDATSNVQPSFEMNKLCNYLVLRVKWKFAFMREQNSFLIWVIQMNYLSANTEGKLVSFPYYLRIENALKMRKVMF